MAVPARDRGPEAGEDLETRREREGLCSGVREAPRVSVQPEHPLEESSLLPTGPRVPELVDGTSTGCSRKRGCGRTGLSAHLHTGVQGGEGQSGAPSAWDHAWVQRPPLLPPPSPRVRCSLTFNILPRRPVSFPPGLAPSVRDQVPPPPDAAGRRGRGRGPTRPCAQTVSWKSVSSDGKPAPARRRVASATGARGGGRAAPPCVLWSSSLARWTGERTGLQVLLVHIAPSPRVATGDGRSLQRTRPGRASEMGRGRGRLRAARNRGTGAGSSPGRRLCSSRNPGDFPPGSTSGEKGS